MAKKQQEFVKEITPMEEDFSQWYTDVILKTDLVDYAPVKGCMVDVLRKPDTKTHIFHC
ncbi:MAG: proline--tRNA ligase [Clostridia bacterium]|nr:proline--tRNA ligase [Clostridia bacterium]